MALGFEFGLLCLEVSAAGVDVAGSSVEFFHVDVAGLVEVGEAASLGGGLFDAALESVELGGEQLVVGGRLAGDERPLAGDEHVGAQQDLAHLVEHERVELVSADHLLGAALAGPAGLDRVVVCAAVVAVLARAAVGARARLSGAGPHAAAAAVDQPAQ